MAFFFVAPSPLHKRDIEKYKRIDHPRYKEKQTVLPAEICYYHNYVRNYAGQNDFIQRNDFNFFMEVNFHPANPFVI